MINSQLKLILVILGSFLAQIVQVGVFPLFLATVLDDLGISLSTIGWYLSTQWCVVLLLAPVVPRFTAKFGLTNTNKLSGIITLIGLVLVQQGNDVFALLSACFVGAGLILRWIACDSLVVQLSLKGKIGRSIGLHEALMGFGIAVGPLLFAWFVLEDVHYASLVIILMSTMIFVLMQNEPKAKHNQKVFNLKLDELKLLQIALMIAVIGGFIETASVALLPFYFAVDGFSLVDSAWFVSAFGFGGTLLQLPLGYLVDKLGYTKVQLIACMFALLGIAVLFVVPSEFLTLYLTLFIFGGCVGAFNTLAVIQAGLQIEAQKSASAMAYIAICYTIGSVVGPLAVSGVLDTFPSAFFLGLYALIILGAGIWIILFSVNSKPS